MSVGVGCDRAATRRSARRVVSRAARCGGGRACERLSARAAAPRAADPSRAELSGDLLREEGIASRCLLDPDQGRAWQRAAEPVPEQLMGRGERERPDVNPPRRSCRRVRRGGRRRGGPRREGEETSSPTRSSPIRRAANCRARADGASSHCTSSTATTTGVSEASAFKSTAPPRRPPEDRVLTSPRSRRRRVEPSHWARQSSEELELDPDP